MENKGLLFIPDITGFTFFINNVELTHGKKIIKELLELLIDSNELGLDISEVEGDAILFYKFGEPPSIRKIYEQVEKMFLQFHQHLRDFENCRTCECKACSSAISLTLKIITHYGEFTVYNVKSFFKLIGKDIIVAHQLLKNDINIHEYWLVTKSLLKGNPIFSYREWMQWDKGIKQIDGKKISFNYLQLGHLKSKLLGIG